MPFCYCFVAVSLQSFANAVSPIPRFAARRVRAILDRAKSDAKFVANMSNVLGNFRVKEWVESTAKKELDPARFKIAPTLG